MKDFWRIVLHVPLSLPGCENFQQFNLSDRASSETYELEIKLLQHELATVRNESGQEVVQWLPQENQKLVVELELVLVNTGEA